MWNSRFQDRCRGFLEFSGRTEPKALSVEQFTNETLSAGEFTDRLLRRFPEMTAIACDGDHIAMSLFLAPAGVGHPDPGGSFPDGIQLSAGGAVAGENHKRG